MHQKNTFALLFTTCILFVAILFSQTIAQGVSSCVAFLFSVVLPALFPYIFLGALLIELCQKPFKNPFFDAIFKHLFSLDSSSAIPIFLCAVCGFPTGALCIEHAVENQTLDRTSAKRLLLFATVPSPAFCISFLGGQVFLSTKLGAFLYLSCLLSAWTAGIVLAKIDPVTPKSIRPKTKIADRSLGEQFMRATKRAAAAFAMLGATLILLRAALECIFVLTENFVSSQYVSCGIYCLFDLVGGCAKLASLPLHTAIMFAAFFLSFQGLGIYLQSYSALASLKVKKRSFWCTKLLCSLFSLIFMWIFKKLL